MTINKLLKSAAVPILFGAFISATATPAFAACVTNSNGDVFCYTTLPPMPPPKLEMMKVDLPPSPGHKWVCIVVEGGKKKCNAIAIKKKGFRAERMRAK